jgi:transposase
MSCAAGIDVGKSNLDLALAPSGRGLRAPNDAAGIARIVERLKRHGVRRVIVESIGIYALGLLRVLRDEGFQVGVVDPRRIKAFRTAEGGRAKNDRLDAKLIARFALTMSRDPHPAPSPEMLEIRALSTRRRQLVELAAAEKTRLKQAPDAAVADSCRHVIALLEAERDRVEADLHNKLMADDRAQRVYQILTSIPGIGPKVAITLMADLPELGHLDRRAIASLAGLAPFDDDSGNRRGGRHIAGGRPCVRAALYLAALAASRSEKGYKAERAALINKGKPPKVATIAIARKLLVAANAMIKQDKLWQKNDTD